MKPLVSIIIPLYNRENLILGTLDSVFSQTYRNWECIIVDDGSTDNSYNVVDQYIKSKSRYKLYKRPSQHKPGGAGARNFGFLKSKGEYILWLDSDDLLEKNKIELQIKDLLEYNADLSITKWRYFPDETLVNKYPEKLFNYTKTDFITVIKTMGEEKSFLALHSYLIKREVISKSGLWLEDLHLNDDGEFFTRILINSQTIIPNNNTHALYRIHSGDRLSQKTSIEKFKECILSWRLIEAHLKLIDEQEFNTYLYHKKNILFHQLIDNNYRNLINSNQDFFKHQLKVYKEYNSYYNRIKTWLHKKIYSN